MLVIFFGWFLPQDMGEDERREETGGGMENKRSEGIRFQKKEYTACII